MSWEGIAAICAIVTTLGVLATFLIQGYQNGVEKGRLMQRVDELERSRVDHGTRIGCVESNHSSLNGQFGEVKAGMEYLIKRVDEIVRRMGGE